MTRKKIFKKKLQRVVINIGEDSENTDSELSNMEDEDTDENTDKLF